MIVSDVQVLDDGLVIVEGTLGEKFQLSPSTPSIPMIGDDVQLLGRPADMIVINGRRIPL